MSSTSRGAHAAAVWSALLVTLLWSSSWVLIRLGLDEESLEPLTFAGLRYGLAALVLVTWTALGSGRRQQVARLDRPTLWRLGRLGLVVYALTQGAQFVALDHQPAATTSVVLSVTPLAVAALGSRTLGEVATSRQVLGAVLVAVGGWLYFSGALGATTIGMVAALVALASNATGSVAGRAVNRSAHLAPLLVTTVSMTVGAAALLLVGITVEGWPSVGLRAALLIGWLAVVNTALAFTLWNRSLRHLSALGSAGINNTMLLQVAVLGWLFLGEVPSPRQVVGIVVVSAGVLLTQVVAVRWSRPPAQRGRGPGSGLQRPAVRRERPEER